MTHNRQLAVATAPAGLAGSSGLCGVLFLVCVLGCAERPSGHDAEWNFSHGFFDQAIAQIDEQLPGAHVPAQRAKLLTLKGRCFWEKSAVGDATSAATALNEARTLLTASIGQVDTPEARMIRSMVLDKLGLTAEAEADRLAYQQMDPSYEKAFLNEPVVETPSVAPESSQDTATAKDEGADGPSEILPETQRDIAAEVADPSAMPAETPSGQPSLTERHRYSRPGVDSRLTTSFPGSTESTEESAETAEDEGTATAEPTPPANPTSEEGEVEPARPLFNRPSLPGSTWQPPVAGTAQESLPNWSGPTAGPAGVGGTGIGSTGIGGTGVPTGLGGNVGQTTSPGIPGYMPPTVPTTGISGNLLRGSGQPSSTWSPVPPNGLQVNGWGGIPYTGALPPQMRPAGAGAPPGSPADVFRHGPSYSPLFPSPLTNPELLAPRIAPPAFSTNPLLAPHTTNQPTVKPIGPAVRPAASVEALRKKASEAKPTPRPNSSVFGNP